MVDSQLWFCPWTRTVWKRNCDPRTAVRGTLHSRRPGRRHGLEENHWKPEIQTEKHRNGHSHMWRKHWCSHSWGVKKTLWWSLLRCEKKHGGRHCWGVKKTLRWSLLRCEENTEVVTVEVWGKHWGGYCWGVRKTLRSGGHCWGVRKTLRWPLLRCGEKSGSWWQTMCQRQNTKPCWKLVIQCYDQVSQPVC